MKYSAPSLCRKISRCICTGQPQQTPALRLRAANRFMSLLPVPNLNAGIDWDTQGPLLRQRIIESLSEHMLPDLEQHLVTAFYMTPEDFESDYLSVGGAGFSVAPLFTQSAWFRFHNKAEGPENLYLVGAGTHPGAGLPGVVSSAKVLDHLFLKSSAVLFFRPRKAARPC